MKKILVSLNCSGESFEKTITHYYLSYIDNFEFYNKYKVQLFYGYNLPKKNKNICSHGSIGFYEKYYSNINFIPNCKKDYLIKNKGLIIEKLVKNRLITDRSIKKIEKNNELFWNYIKKLPMEFLYPDFIKKIKERSCEIFNLAGIDNLYLDRNFVDVINNTKEEKWRYNIYGLNYNGIIGKYDIIQKRKKSFSHLFDSLKYNSILSGNSAIFLLEIQRRLVGKKVTYGYREHKKHPRPNRDYEMSRIKEQYNCVLEPKNSQINSFFKNVNQLSSDEEKANEVYAQAFLKFLTDNYEKLLLESLR